MRLLSTRFVIAMVVASTVSVSRRAWADECPSVVDTYFAAWNEADDATRQASLEPILDPSFHRSGNLISTRDGATASDSITMFIGHVHHVYPGFKLKKKNATCAGTLATIKWTFQGDQKCKKKGGTVLKTMSADLNGTSVLILNEAKDKILEEVASEDPLNEKAQMDCPKDLYQ